MKKVKLFALIIFILAISCAAASAGDILEGVVSLGQDHVQMTWWLLAHMSERASPETGAPTAIVRKYYTNVGIRNETIELLMSKFAIDPDVAGRLFFTEYRYIYSADHRTFAVGYIRHYNMVGVLIHGTEFDGSTPDTQLTWVGVIPDGPSGRALNEMRRRENIPVPR